MSLYYDCSEADERRFGLDAAVDAIRRGDLVVLPTDTVYGLGADAFSASAVTALFTAKGRGREMPPPVLVGSWTGLDGLMVTVDPVARDLVEAFWPGGLTIIVEHAPSLDWDLGDNRGTVGVRMPAHPVAIDLLERTGPLAVSSANRTGQPSPTTGRQAQQELGQAVDVYLDAGPCASSLASTIVDLTGPEPVVRREGTISIEQLREVVPNLVVPEVAKPQPEPEPEPEPAPDPETEPETEAAPEPEPEPEPVPEAIPDPTAPQAKEPDSEAN